MAEMTKDFTIYIDGKATTVKTSWIETEFVFYTTFFSKEEREQLVETIAARMNGITLTTNNLLEMDTFNSYAIECENALIDAFGGRWDEAKRNSLLQNGALCAVSIYARSVLCYLADHDLSIDTLLKENDNDKVLQYAKAFRFFYDRDDDTNPRVYKLTDKGLETLTAYVNERNARGDRWYYQALPIEELYQRIAEHGFERTSGFGFPAYGLKRGRDIEVIKPERYRKKQKNIEVEH